MPTPKQKPAGRHAIHGTRKRNRALTITDEGWAGAKAIAKSHGLSTSEFLERIGRGEFVVTKVKQEPEQTAA